MVVRLQIRHDIKSEWELYNPVLASGELGIETDNAEGQRIKIGDGNRAWIDLPFIDDKSVHKYADEEIYGNKIFHNSLLLRQGAEIPEGQILNGLADSASKDDEGNVIKDYYQPKIVVVDEITSETDWNTLIKEGIYKVNIDTWGSASTLHGPNEYIGNIYSKGILCVHANQGFVTQVYYPYMESPIVYRNFNDVEWQTWSSISNLDRTIVHTTGDETIAGNKTFSNNVVLNNGNINFNLVGDALILKGGEPFIKKSTDNDTYLSASEGGSIHFRPNGDTSVEGEVIIDNQGIIQGKVTQDGAGNVITDTYARRDQMEEVANNEGLTAVFLGRNLLDNPSGYTEVKEMYRSTFDRAKFTIEGTPTITKDGIASGFSENNTVKIPDKYFPSNLSALDISLLINTQNLSNANQGAFGCKQKENTSIAMLDIRVTNSGGQLVYSTGLGTQKDTTFTAQWLGQGKDKINFKINNSKIELFINEELSLTVNDFVYVQPIDFYIGSNRNKADIFQDSIDLKQFSITVDGKEVFNGNKTGIDVIKQDSYEIVGSPVISDDGILYSGDVDLQNYITIPSPFNTLLQSTKIEFEWKSPSSEAVGNYVINGGIELYREAKNQYSFNFKDIENTVTKIGDMPVLPNTYYNISFIIENNTIQAGWKLKEDTEYSYTDVLNIENGIQTDDIALVSGIDIGSIDLNTFKIYADDELIYQPCLRIPYNKTNAGVKISNINYRDRIEDCYTYYNTANYFIIDEENELYQIPYDVPDGHCVIIAQERNGINLYEYNTNLECTQTGSCTANTEFTFSIPYANDQYALSCPYSAKSRTGFTPTVTGDFISKGLIFLSDTQ